MKRILAFLTILFILAGSSALAEEPATPTDLCPHEHTEDLCYFDNPSYINLDSTHHRVYGAAYIDTRCLDCGQIIASVTRREAEQTRPHSFKNGVCVLCGARQQESGDSTISPEESPNPSEPLFQDAPGEHSMIPLPEDPESTRLILILAPQDLTDLEESYETLLIRPESGTAAIALPIYPLREELITENATLRAEIEETEDNALFAALRLQDIDQDFSMETIEVRFYEPQSPITILYQPESPDLPILELTPIPAETYTVIPWQGPGIYTPII